MIRTKKNKISLQLTIFVLFSKMQKIWYLVQYSILDNFLFSSFLSKVVSMKPYNNDITMIATKRDDSVIVFTQK